MQTSFRHFLAVCLFALIPLSLSVYGQKASGTTSPAPAAGPDDEPVTQLDTLVITARTELPPPETWLTTTIPGFTIYSSASERASRKLIQDFENFRIALDAAWPIKAKIRRPATLILCGRAGFEQFIPRSDHASFSKDSGRASTTLIGRERDFLVVDMGTSTMSLNNLDFDLDTSALGAVFEVDYFALLYREYVHYLLSQSDTPPPVWYEEGVLQIIQKMEVYPKYIRIGELRSVPSGKPKPSGFPSMPSMDGDGEDSFGAGEGDDEFSYGMETIPDQDFNVALRRRRLLGFKEFFGVTRDSPAARTPIGNNVWAKQCYAFVHMCTYALPNKYKTALETLVARSAKEPVTEELFKECFGKSYSKMMVELRGYIGFTAYQFTDYVVKKGSERITSPPREFVYAPEGDAARMKAEALMLANNPEPAMPTLRGAYGRGERNPEFLATYGLAAYATNQGELARRMLSKAVEGKTTRAAAYAVYADLLLADAKAHPAASDGAHITPSQLAPVLELLFKARGLRPAQSQTYRTIAEAWLACSAVPKPENFTVLTEGLILFPKDLELVYLAARVSLKMKDARAAGALIGHGLAKAPDDAARARFSDLKAELATIPVAAPPVSPQEQPKPEPAPAAVE